MPTADVLTDGTVTLAKRFTGHWFLAIFSAIAVLLRKWGAPVFSYLGSSDYLFGMLAMSAMGVARDGVAAFFKELRTFVVQCLWVTVSLSERDAELLLAWLRERPEVHRSPNVSLFSRGSTRGDGRLYEYEPEVQTSTTLRYKAKQGSRHWMWINRREGNEGPTERLRGMQVSFFGRRSKVLIEEILEAGRDIQRRKREKYLTVVQVYDFAKDYGLGWLHPQESDRKQAGRSISSVVLPRDVKGTDQAQALLEDAREFLSAESWYSERGIPYRRGYLLHGVPGGGKSSLIMAVASELRLPIYMLQLSSELLTDEKLNSLLQHGMHDPPTILLLEDVDLLHTVTLNRVEAEKARDLEDMDREESTELRRLSEKVGARRKGGRLTLSGLLNALDGPTATSGRLLFMTTNAKHRLDPALIRSGRIDYEIEYQPADHEQICRFVTRFYSDFDALQGGALSTCVLHTAAAESARRFADEVQASGAKLTTADIQRHLMKHKKDLNSALEELPALLKSMTDFDNQAQNLDGGLANGVASEAPSPEKAASPEKVAVGKARPDRPESPCDESGSEKACDCGEILILDSVFCRKCGKKCDEVREVLVKEGA